MSRPTRSFDRTILFAVACLTVLLVCSPIAQVSAQGRQLDTLRAQGVIGERYDGLLVLRDANAPATVKRLVTETNAQRRALYERRARETGGSVQEIAKVYAQEILNNAPSGTWFLTQSGQWIRR